MPILLPTLLNFQGSAHLFGVGSFSNEYKAIKLFNYKSDNFAESIERCRDSFIVVDNADNLINDKVRRFINFEPSNQYMLFLRNCDGLNVSDKSFKVLKFDNNRITLEEEL